MAKLVFIETGERASIETYGLNPALAWLIIMVNGMNDYLFP
jgi:hypothetical protein